MSRGLLGRIGLATSAGDSTEAIARHLSALLNSGQGESITSPDYGVVDFSDLVHEFPNAIPVLQQAIRNCITSFEPRLRNVSVRHIPDDSDPLTLNFEIVARLASDRRQVLRLNTRVKAGGNIEVG